jgi:hypothetical protein
LAAPAPRAAGFRFGIFGLIQENRKKESIMTARDIEKPKAFAAVAAGVAAIRRIGGGGRGIIAGILLAMTASGERE